MEESQHGSRNEHGSLIQGLSQYDTVVSKLASRRIVDIVYLDFAKAFDMVYHSNILEKMKKEGDNKSDTGVGLQLSHQ